MDSVTDISTQLPEVQYRDLYHAVVSAELSPERTLTQARPSAQIPVLRRDLAGQAMRHHGLRRS